MNIFININGFSNIAEYLSDPLVLVGFVVLIFYLLFKNRIKEALGKVSKDNNAKFLFKIVNGIIGIIILLIVAGYAFKFFEERNKAHHQFLNQLEILPIDNLEQKITKLKINLMDNDTINVIFESNLWEIRKPLVLSNKMKVNKLKNSLVQYFEFEKYLKYNTDIYSSLDWLIIADNTIINNENMSLKQAGIQQGDKIELKVQGAFIAEKGIDKKINEEF
ncbi:hypothetical protein [Aquimarina sp. SS2-1]|uniref:hypothetical protein n=1 Tax=Aquimarina besae TaxID=3342247 RepID=UPI003670B72A